MSNRRRMGKPWLSLGFAGRRAATVASQGPIQTVEMPNDEKVVIKEVPALANGIEVGKALIYDDGSVDLIYNEDAPESALLEIKETAEAFGLGYQLPKEL